MSLQKNGKYIVFVKVIFQPKYKESLYYARQCSKVSLPEEKGGRPSATKMLVATGKEEMAQRSREGLIRQFDQGKQDGRNSQ